MDLSKYEGKGLIGLENMGNTCFLNSCMQVLNNTYELNHFLDMKSYEQFIKHDIPDSGILTEWNELRNIMWSGNGIVTPRKFVHNVREIAKKKDRDLFTGNAQNDMTEFLLFFMDCIHSSISRRVKVNIMGNAVNSIDEKALKCYKMISDTYSKEYSEIMELFYGIYVSEIISINAGTIESIKPESFFILDLQIHNNNDIFTDIYECLNDYVKPDELIGDNAWFNEKTNKLEDVHKQIRFWSFPKIVIITLNRFTPDGSSKINNNIKFPIDNLDLSKYVTGYNATSYKYELYGICNHIGNVRGGHYTAFVRNTANTWLHYNDRDVEKVDNPEAIISSAAYCLFYRKKNNNV
tara:strand:- start:853 stop:1905 length:1053 start_codon:yes stop_codon:yes gene_type:complete